VKWYVHCETDKYAEYHESSAGRVERTISGWDAWVLIPDKFPAMSISKHKVGECYSSAGSARAAVVRTWKKYAPVGARLL
jgi:hypothetical protein